jgi:thiamine-monophosphate kinase
VPSVGSLGEDDFVAGVIAATGAGSGSQIPAWLTVGPGDDAAVADLAGLPGLSGLPGTTGGSLVASTDTLVEDQDFKQHWSSAADVGVKVAAQNFADIAAMGATPVMLLVSLALPGSADVAWADGLSAGLAQECARAGAVVAGGDVSQATQIVITGTAIGVLPPGQAAVLRSGARPGDVVAVAGELGRSGAGLALLEHGYRAGTGNDEHSATSTGDLDPDARAVVTALIQAHQRPVPPYSAGPRAAAAGATALIDTSDGLIRDVGRIAAASGVTIDLDGGRLTPPAELLQAGELLGLPPSAPLTWVLTGGEDHALVACFDPGQQLPAGFIRIGEAGKAVKAERAVQPGAVLIDGRPWTGDPGWRHFTG